MFNPKNDNSLRSRFLRSTTDGNFGIYAAAYDLNEEEEDDIEDMDTEEEDF